MQLISEFRYPTTWYAKLVTTALALLVFALLGALAVSSFLVYRVLLPTHIRTDIDTQGFPGHPAVVQFTVAGGGGREGWFFPGLRTAPTIIVCHGYLSNRAELLTLVTALQDHQYNVFAFDFASHGSSPGYTTLGYRETQEVQAAIAAVARRDDVDRSRFGLWGASLGGYAAMAAAAADARVRAVAVDSVYDQPIEMLRLQVRRSGLNALPLVERASRWIFLSFNRAYRSESPLAERLARLAGVPKLFIYANDEPELAQSTRELFLRAPEPREQLILARGNYAGMLDEEKRSYENHIVSFFLRSLPPAAAARR